MLHAPEVVEVVAWAIDHYGLQRVVLDPVMVATSGDRLIAQETVQVMVRELFPRASVVTPNLDEAALLVGHRIAGEGDMQAAAAELLSLGARAVLLKGGHLAGDAVSDLLLVRGAAPQWMRSPRIATPNTHGTGCTLSAAIAAFLAQRDDVTAAVSDAKEYITGAIAGADQLSVGSGHGPVHHFHRLWR